MNQAFFEALYLDDNGVQADMLHPPFDDIQEAERLWTTTSRPSATKEAPALRKPLIGQTNPENRPLPVLFRSPVWIRPLWWS